MCEHQILHKPLQFIIVFINAVSLILSYTLFTTNHLYSSNCQYKIAFFTYYLVGIFVVVCVCMCVCLWCALNSKIVCFCEFLCMWVYMPLCDSEWVFMHVFLTQTFAFWILRNSYSDFNTYNSPHQPSNLVLILYLATLLLSLTVLKSDLI